MSSKASKIGPYFITRNTPTKVCFIFFFPCDLSLFNEPLQHTFNSFVGKVVGRYYTSTGERTDYYKDIEKQIQQAVDNNAAQNAEYLKYPPCNVEWTPETGSKVWCSNRR